MRVDQFSRLLLLAYLVGLAVLVFLPSGRAMDLGHRVNLEPLVTIDRALELGPRSWAFRLMLGNVAAFIPLGVLLPLAFPAGRRVSLGLVLVTAVVVASAIEVGQFVVSMNLGYAYRSTDVDDVILNVLGAGIGYVALVVTRAMGSGLQLGR